METKHELDREYVKEFILNQPEGTKVYIGGDSERYKKDGAWYADYTVVVVVHYAGNKGCKVFGEITKERDFDQKKNKPRVRLMTEVMKTAQMYIDLSDVLEDIEVEIHLDINPDEMYGSSCVIKEAVSYIKGMCNITPLVKPEAFAASYCADRYKDAILHSAA